MVMVGLATIGKSSCVKTEASLPQSRGNCLQATRTAFAPIFFAFLYPTITTKLPFAPLLAPIDKLCTLPILVHTITMMAVSSFTTLTLAYIQLIVAATFTINCITILASGPLRLAVWAIRHPTFITLHGCGEKEKHLILV